MYPAAWSILVISQCAILLTGLLTLPFCTKFGRRTVEQDAVGSVWMTKNRIHKRNGTNYFIFIPQPPPTPPEDYHLRSTQFDFQIYLCDRP